MINRLNDDELVIPRLPLTYRETISPVQRPSLHVKLILAVTPVLLVQIGSCGRLDCRSPLMRACNLPLNIAINIATLSLYH